jgi:hypothetical protein
MREIIPSGTLRGMLLPPTYGRHVTDATAFTVLSVEIWATGLVVNIQVAADGGRQPDIILQDHFGTEYTLQDSAALGSRVLQVFTPSVPRGTRSLTIRSADGSGRPVVTFAVPLMSVPDTADMAGDAGGREAGGLEAGYPPELRRPA